MENCRMCKKPLPEFERSRGVTICEKCDHEHIFKDIQKLLGEWLAIPGHQEAIDKGAVLADMALSEFADWLGQTLTRNDQD